MGIGLAINTVIGDPPCWAGLCLGVSNGGSDQNRDNDLTED
jgi:hypothetical protein